MKQTTSQIQKKVIIIIALALASIITKAQSQTDTYTSIAFAETEEDINTVELETSAVDISSAAASEKILEIGKTYSMKNNTSTQETGWTNVSATTNTGSLEAQETSDENFLYVLNRAIEETKRAKIENTYLRLIQK